MNLLITSAQLVENELRAEFGNVIPAFLPVKGRFLIEHQVEIFATLNLNNVYVSMPEGYELTAAEYEVVERAKLIVLKVNDSLSLGESIYTCLTEANLSQDCPIAILHGDTLYSKVEIELDSIYVTESPDINYSWGRLEAIKKSGPQKASKQLVMTGFFVVSDPSYLCEALDANHGSWVSALSFYSKRYCLKQIVNNTWKDFGHSTSYHREKAKLTNERSFNKLKSLHRTMLKSGTNEQKLRAESSWFNSIPQELKLYTPRLVGQKENPSFGYEIELLHYSTVAELYVFSRLTEVVWDRIFNAIDEVLKLLQSHTPSKERFIPKAFDYIAHTQSRLKTFAEQTGFQLNQQIKYDGKKLGSLDQIVKSIATYVPRFTPDHFAIVHGDMCASNILYDYRTERIYMIDPRGLDFEGRISHFGDRRYDVSKLLQSFSGNYDNIISGHFKLKILNNHDFLIDVQLSRTQKRIEESFLSRKYGNQDPNMPEYRGIMLLQFLAMLPLHMEDPIRTKALLANALRLFVEFEKASWN